jgi:hypothetical protein
LLCAEDNYQDLFKSPKPLKEKEYVLVADFEEEIMLALLEKLESLELGRRHGLQVCMRV